MKAVLQRVSESSVVIEGNKTAHINNGLMILLGITNGDTMETARFMAEKAANLRIFEDEGGKLNLSLLDVGGAALVVSNFTLYADCKKGRRPSFVNAARPETADPIYLYFVQCLRDCGIQDVQTGEFGAEMKVSIINEGPVTIVLDSDEIKPKE